MAIRINLLAEAQALEELRRRDPVKRAIWGGAMLVSVLVAYCLWLQVGAMRAKGELKAVNTQIDSHKSEYTRVTNDRTNLIAISFKLAKLLQLSTNRFLNANVLDALQHTTVEDVQLTHFSARQKYVLTPEVPAQTNDDRIIPAKPATIKEEIVLTFDATDTSGTGGDQVAKYRAALGNCTYFQHATSKSNQAPVKLINSGPQGPDGRYPFSLELRYPDKIR